MRLAPGHERAKSQRQAMIERQCIGGMQQRSGTHAHASLQSIAKALLQYFGGAHGVVASGFVTREE
ncbi:hypothetical protein [Rhodanobacter soli]|uniref:hypothetical protein n=1 Tax=Rhodanobacter soli TaxID=590609 RepID=UPI0031D36754